MAFIKFKPLTPSFNFTKTLLVEELPKEIVKYFVKGEKIVKAFKARRDIGIFTNKRILLIDKKGIIGFRERISSINYSSITSYDLNIRHIDTYIDLTLNSGHKVYLNFVKPIPLSDMYEIYWYIANYVINEDKE